MRMLPYRVFLNLIIFISKVFLFTRNVYTFGPAYTPPGNRLIEPKESYWNLYSW